MITIVRGCLDINVVNTYSIYIYIYSSTKHLLRHDLISSSLSKQYAYHVGCTSEVRALLYPKMD